MLDFRAGWRGIRVKRTFSRRAQGVRVIEAGAGAWSPVSPTLPCGISSNGPSCFGRTCEVLVGRNCYRSATGSAVRISGSYRLRSKNLKNALPS